MTAVDGDAPLDEAAESRSRHEETLTRLARGGSLNLVGAAVSGAVGILVVVVVARALDVTAAGSFFAATSVFLIVVAVVELGADTGLVRFLPKYLVERRHRDIRTALWVALLPVAVLAIVGAVVLLIVAPGLTRLGAGSDSSDSFVDALRLLALFLPLAAATDVALAATQGYGTMRPNVLIERFGRSALQGLAVLAAVLVADRSSLDLVTLAWAAPYALSAAAALWALAWIVRRRERADRAYDATHEGALATAAEDGRTTREVAGEFWRYTGPRAVARISQAALQRSDIVLIAALRSPAEAAIYTAATRFLVFGQLGTLAIQQVLAPQLSRLLTLGDSHVANKVFQTSTAWLMTLSWPIYLVSATCAPVLLLVFGRGYESGHATIVILSLTMLLASAAGPVDVALLMGGRSGLSLANNVISLVVDIGLNLVLIPAYGLTGAAISWSVALIVRNVLPLVQVRSMMHMSPFGRGAGWVAVSSVLCFGLLPLVAGWAWGQTVPVAAVAVAVGCLGYSALLWRGRRVVEIDAFRTLLRPARPAGRTRPT